MCNFAVHYMFEYKFYNMEDMLILRFENSTFGVIMTWSGRVG